MPPKPKKPGGGGNGNGSTGKPPQTHGSINAGQGITSALTATAEVTNKGKVGGGSGQQPTTPGTSNKPSPPTKPIQPPTATDIRHSDRSRQHIIHGDGGRQGGHLAGTGFSKKTEFPQSWGEAKILDAAYQVTQQGPPAKGPYLTKDADGNPAWAYDYSGTVDGVEVKTTVLANGEIRTAYPPNSADPGVITNPPAPNPAPSGIPMGNPPRYSHPDVGGDGSWTWEGPKGDKIIKVVQDAQGNVTTTVLGDYKKK
jgi:Bacterial EndoU nuclease